MKFPEQEGKRKQDSKKTNEFELSGGDVLLGNIMSGIFCSGEAVDVGDRYIMTKTGEMEALLFSRYRRRSL
eukprot:15364785-Ditylum_brightwellii.AAC.2